MNVPKLGLVVLVVLAVAGGLSIVADGPGRSWRIVRDWTRALGATGPMQALPGDPGELVLPPPPVEARPDGLGLVRLTRSPLPQIPRIPSLTRKTISG